MSKLEQLINELCPDGVEYASLGFYCKILKGKQLNKENLLEKGDYPAYNGGTSYSGFTNNYNVEANTTIISQGGASAGFVQFIKTRFWANAHCYYLQPDCNFLNNKYIFHFIKSMQSKLMECQHGAGIPALKSNEIYKLQIPLPPLPVQEEIVRILDIFTELTAELTTELTMRKKQYEYYRNSLLTFGDEIKWKTLEEVCELSAGGDVPKNNWSKEITENYYVPIYSNGIENDGLYGYTDSPRIEKPSVTIAGRGVGVGNAILRKNPYFPIIRLISATPKDEIIVDFLYYFIKTVVFKVPTSGIPQLTIPMIKNIQIPLPPLEEQQRIVDILDRFDTLVNDIKEGLPAEIAARKQQYEYYRDKLLTFKKLEA